MLLVGPSLHSFLGVVVVSQGRPVISTDEPILMGMSRILRRRRDKVLGLYKYGKPRSFDSDDLNTDPAGFETCFVSRPTTSVYQRDELIPLDHAIDRFPHQPLQRSIVPSPASNSPPSCGS